MASETSHFELFLLWKTLALLKDNESIISFYSNMVEYLASVPPLYLSTYRTTTLLSSQPELGVRSGLPDLYYLSNIQGDEFKHDPFGIAKKIYYTAASYVSVVSEVDRPVLLRACVCIAVKTGRASLILDSIRLLQTYPHIFLGDLAVINEIALFHKERVIDAPLKSTTTHNAGERTQRDSHVGVLLSFGKADHGKLGHGEINIHRFVPSVIEALAGMDVIKMSSMSTYAVAVDRRGTVYVWGTGGSAGSAHSSSGVAASYIPDIQPQILEALSPKFKVVDLSCGLGHALFLLDRYVF
jgi:hypothetical protein